MRFGPNNDADTSTVEDRRGFPGGRLGMAGGGLGVVGVIVALLFQVLGGGDAGGGVDSPSSDRTLPGASPGVSHVPTTSAIAGGSCQGVTSQTDQAKFIVCVETNVQSFWRDELQKSGKPYDVAKLVLFTERTPSACGTADEASGPFYCPPDGKVYLDLGFFQELKARFGAEGGDFAEAYVVAHEYGHHVQDLLGLEKKMRAAGGRGAGSDGSSVRVELQADCYAGVWGHAAYGAGTVSSAEIAQALDAAAAVGDDRIQKETRGRVNPETFTHGTSAQRQKWFNAGMTTGDPKACDTFANLE